MVLVRPDFVLLAANRDERLDRPWDPPAAWWPDQPDVVAGRDRSAGGTWMGLNRCGVAAAVLNRPGTLGPAAGMRSRGELPLIALRHPTAAAAVKAITALDATMWRAFNMVVADRAGAYFIRADGRAESQALPEGVWMVTAHDPNDLDSPRTARHLPRLRARVPNGPDDQGGWRAILADRAGSSAEQINVAPRRGFGTVCGSFLSLPVNGPVTWAFAAGPPHSAAFQPVFFPWDTAAIPAAARAL